MTVRNEAPEIGTTDYKKDTMTVGDKCSVAFFILLFWIILGSGTAAIMSEVIGLDDDTVAQRLALVIFWPIFAIKYLALGGWEVLSAFWSLITA